MLLQFLFSTNKVAKQLQLFKHIILMNKIIWTSLMREFFFLWVLFMEQLCLIWIHYKAHYFKMMFYLHLLNYKMKQLLLLILDRSLQNLMLQRNCYLIRKQLCLLVNNSLNFSLQIIIISYKLLKLFVIRMKKIKNNWSQVLYRHHLEDRISKNLKIHRKFL